MATVRSQRTTRNARKELVAAEFFAGIGLVRLALEQAGWKIAFANDIDPRKEKMYAANFGTDDFILEDIHKLSAAEIPACDLYTDSFPCNDLSIAGTRTATVSFLTRPTATAHSTRSASKIK